MTLEELIDRFKNNLSLMVKFQCEKITMHCTEYDLKSIVYYLSELKYLKGFRVLLINDFNQIDKDKLQKIMDEAKPSIMPDNHTAKWDRVLDGAWVYSKCSFCGSIQDVRSNYCPNCGAKMEESEDGKNI